MLHMELKMFFLGYSLSDFVEQFFIVDTHEHTHIILPFGLIKSRKLYLQF